MDFQINNSLSVTCEREKTRNGFKHTAELYSNGVFIDETKVCYLNRTWEKFEFDTVLEKLSVKTKCPEIRDFVKTRTNDSGTKFLNTVSAIASLGSLFFDDEKSQNKFKSNILKAGLNANFPDDFESLPEAEKSRRLNSAIDNLKQ